MRNLQRLIDYGEKLSNFEEEKVKGLHLALNPGKALYLSHRVDNEHGTITHPFYLPRKPEDLRKIALAINELADEIERN